ncbi:MAG: hypothetical protein ABR549_06305 [Mycobacteriales bacterium]
MRRELTSWSLAFRLPDGRWDLTLRRLTGVVLTVRPRTLRTKYSVKPDVATVFLSALREAPDLFTVPQKPLSEIFPLEGGRLHDTRFWEAHRDGRRLTSHLPERVYDELARRSDLLGEHLVDHAAVLLGAALDRVVPPSDRYSYHDDLEPEYLRERRSVLGKLGVLDRRDDRLPVPAQLLQHRQILGPQRIRDALPGRTVLAARGHRGVGQRVG